jgi:hypothetical protein
VLSLENGEMAVLNLGLDVVFKIPSIASSQRRFAINLLNPFKGEVEGNFLIVSDGPSINANIWIKQGAIDQILQSIAQQQSGGSSYRGGRGGHTEHRGSYRGAPRGRGGQGGHQGYQEDFRKYR